MDEISQKLQDNLNYIEGLFEKSVDFTKRKFKICGTDAVLFSLDGMVNKQHISISILNPIMSAPVLEFTGEEKMKFLADEVLGAVEQIKITKTADIIEKMMAGFAVLLLDDCSYGLAFGVQGFEKRSVNEPDNETMQAGSREGFVESYQTNISLIRRRMKNTDLKFERVYVGSESKTPIAICYLKSQVSDEILRKVKNELNICDLKSVMAAGYIAGYIKKSSLFGNAGTTQRPDTVCGKIAEGRVAVIVDGTPTVLIVPHLFVENFQTLDDYATRPFYATAARWLRYIAFFVAVFLPGTYIAVVVHRPELLPDTLMIKIAVEEAKTPFTIMWELLLVLLLYEIMREAGLRAPRVLSQSVSIVGALVIGDTAVQSGIIGAPSLMVIASAAIAGYAVPKMAEQISVLRLVLIVVGGLFGPWGMALAAVALVFNVTSEESYGIPLTSPVSPFSIKYMRDVLLRAPWKVLSRRTDDVQNYPGAKKQ